MANDYQTTIFDSEQEAPEYKEFVEKFKPKKTTDDCYTPPEIYAVVRDWVCERYGVNPANIVRPFYPGGDYENYPYKPDSVVVDNPPFSILSKIIGVYLERNIPFFLFAPSLTAFSGRKHIMQVNHIICDANITYANGAVVLTAFVTDLDKSGVVAESAPDLGEKINSKMAELLKAQKVALPKYKYNDNILTAAMLQYMASHGVAFKVKAADCTAISQLDAQRPSKKTIFGGGLLLSEKAAAEKAAAEKAAAEKAAAIVWELSEREREIVRSLGEKHD